MLCATNTQKHVYCQQPAHVYEYSVSSQLCQTANDEVQCIILYRLKLKKVCANAVYVFQHVLVLSDDGYEQQPKHVSVRRHE